MVVDSSTSRIVLQGPLGLIDFGCSRWIRISLLNTFTEIKMIRKLVTDKFLQAIIFFLKRKKARLTITMRIALLGLLAFNIVDAFLYLSPHTLTRSNGLKISDRRNILEKKSLSTPEKSWTCLKRSPSITCPNAKKEYSAGRDEEIARKAMGEEVYRYVSAECV